MKNLITTLFALAALALTACGGSDGPLVQCNGTPTRAVVYTGAEPFPELAALPDACVVATDSTEPAQINVAIDSAREAAGTMRAYVIGSHEGAAAALQAMSARPGYVEMSSLWYPGAVSAGRIGPSLATIHIVALGGECQPLAAALRAQMVPALCHVSIESRFGDLQRRAALAQLGLR